MSALSMVRKAPFFAERTGLGVRVAVIDSGVNARHPHIRRVAGGVGVRAGGELDRAAYLDKLGHGTAVMAAVQEKAPEADYYAVQLFETSLRTSVDLVVRALDWAIDEGMDIVNLSLGTRNPDHRPRFEAAVERALKRGVLIVSANQTGEGVYLPGSLPGVFGTGLDWDCDRNAFRVESTAAGVSFYASGYPRSLEGVPRERNLHGISFAVANMTGFVVRAYEHVEESAAGRPTADAIRKALLDEAAAQ